MIKPTVGRVVLFHPGASFSGARSRQGEPLPALVCAVWSDTCINIGGFDANGDPYAAMSVLLIQDDAAKPDGVHYCEWIPYQKAQAAKEAPAAVAANAVTAEIFRVTMAQVDSTIVDEAFHVFPGTTLTVCCLTLKNGFTVTGESACASPALFDAEIGQKLAREDAKRKIWSLEGYVLRNQLAATG